MRSYKEDLKDWIKESVSEEVKLIGEKLRTFKWKGKEDLRFDIRKFKTLDTANNMVHYASRYLQNLGHGIDRVTFLLSSGKVLKIAYAGDVAQNRNEVRNYQKFGPKYVPKVFDVGPGYLWIVTELVKVWQTKEQFYRETGIDKAFLSKWAIYRHRKPTAEINLEHFNQWYKENYDTDAQKAVLDVKNTITPIGIELLQKLTDLLDAGVDDIQRWDHWGKTTHDTVVCVDTGNKTDEDD